MTVAARHKTKIQIHHGWHSFLAKENIIIMHKQKGNGS
ncbi:hypothetical protein Bsph_3409 [Lysinibacillus sphaericus C3-41]|uniref:Uncharacterized protein n=1 Tax=Lysinibacillus sphaericus (strain C3-41) TaxID=444177 RepID=B1HRC1_LYSSC|nr:hypothetical protein Bsph_3409 [Lysinibacillus sphaericus C3-41]